MDPWPIETLDQIEEYQGAFARIYLLDCQKEGMCRRININPHPQKKTLILYFPQRRTNPPLEALAYLAVADQPVLRVCSYCLQPINQFFLFVPTVFHVNVLM
jgi:hypothetical protein